MASFLDHINIWKTVDMDSCTILYFVRVVIYSAIYCIHEYSLKMKFEACERNLFHTHWAKGLASSKI